MAANLFEIAQKIGCSMATVSRAINRPEMVSKETLERVQKAVAEMDYAPPSKGKGHKSRIQRDGKAGLKHVGVWFVSNWTYLTSTIQDHLTLSFQRAFEKRGYTALIVNSNSTDEIPEEIHSHPIQGLVIQGLLPGKTLTRYFSDVPRVWMMTRRDPDYVGDYIEPDNVANGKMAAAYLNEQGHNKLVAIVPDPDYPAFAQRYEAFRAEAKLRNCEIEVIEAPHRNSPALADQHPRESIIRDLGMAFGKMNDVPRGYYFCSAFTTSHILQSLPLLGLSLHPQAKIISGDYNSVLYHESGTLLACMDIHLETIIDRTAEQLCWRMKNPHAGGWVGITVSPSLVEPA